MRTTIAKALKGVALGGTLAAIATTGFAANQGSLGFNSTGDLNITMDVNDDLRISNLADIDFGPFTGTGGTVSSPACVYRNSGAPSTNYEITAVGDGLGGGAFAITGLGGATIPYTVNYQDLVANTAIPLTSGTPAGPTGATTVNDNCGGGAANNARIDVTITTAAAAAAPADSYQGLLTLTVAPR